MCLMLWMGTTHPLPPLPRCAPGATPDEVLGYACVDHVPAEAVVRKRFASPHVAYVGSHKGCGCGFESNGLDFDGVETTELAMELLPAMNENEQLEFLAEQRSRAWLRAMVESARTDGPVELFACWAGDECEPALHEHVIDPADLTRTTAPLTERAHYVLR